MSFNEYVKYMTETFIAYFDQPKEDRKKLRKQKKDKRKPFLNEWFGMIPLSLRLWIKRRS